MGPSKEQMDKEYLENLREKHYIEFKRAESALPRDFWETYSAFANTEGGYIFLGVVQEEPKNKIVGVCNPDKVINDLWNLLSNPNKVNYRTVENSGIVILEIEGKKVICIEVTEAPDGEKPIYLNGNIKNAYIRTGDGDRVVTDAEMRAFLRNARPELDSLPREHYSYEDLDRIAVVSFKERVSARYPAKKFTELTPEEFLLQIGATQVNRKTGDIQIKNGCLLFLGKYNSIREAFPNFHLDYLNRKGSNARWIDRVATDEPNEYEMNIYNFYNIVSEKLRLVMQEYFQLTLEQLRVKVSDFDEALREALVNCLAHADYSLDYPGVKVEVYDGWFHFLNPGKMLIPIKSYVNGGNSHPRNEVIMSLFRLLGAAERQGFGGRQIFHSAVSNEYRIPEIETDLQKTDLKLWNVDLSDAYPELSPEERIVFSCIAKAKIPVPRRYIQEMTGLSEHYMRQTLDALYSKGRIDVVGQGKSTRYCPKIGSMEMLTQLHIAIESLHKHMK